MSKSTELTSRLLQVAEGQNLHTSEMVIRTYLELPPEKYEEFIEALITMLINFEERLGNEGNLSNMNRKLRNKDFLMNEALSRKEGKL